MNNDATNLKTYLSLLMDNDIKEVGGILKFTPDELVVYSKLLDNFKNVNGSNCSTEEKGRSLEELTLYVIEKSVIFEVYKNVKTSSNEIDLLVRLNTKGRMLIKDGFIQSEETFLCECKNYNQTIGVTWIGKFYSLLKVTENNLGLLFSYHGFAGRTQNGWTSATGLAKKLFLFDKQNTRLIDFNIEDFEKLLEGHSFIDILNDKIFALQHDLNLNTLITPHPNEQSFIAEN